MVDMFDTKITYSIRVCNVVVFFRLALLSRYLNAYSPFKRTSTGHVATILYHQPHSLTATKKVISDNPISVLFLAFMATLSVFAYFITIFERPGVNRSGYPDTILGYKHIYNQAWWYIWTTMTTIGYGDWFPLTPLGRVSAVLASLCGLVLTAILISAIMTVFQPNASEAKLLRGLDKMERRKERNHRAANVVMACWRWKKGAISYDRYLMVYNKWKQFRRDNKDLNAVFDADDTAGILSDISADLKRCVSTNNVQTITNIFDAKESKQLFVNDSISYDSLQLRDIQRIVRSNMTSP